MRILLRHGCGAGIDDTAPQESNRGTNVMGVPVNHHYVPQHFLKAWAISGASDRLYRFRVVSEANKFECKEVAIRRSGSQDDLYKIRLPDGEFEIESTIVTPQLDELGHKIVARIRSVPFGALNKEEMRELAIYLVCLEARHPEILSQMDVSDDLDRMRNKLKEGSGLSCSSIDEVIDYIEDSPSTGVVAFGLFVQNERRPILGQPFSDGLLHAKAIEYVFDTDCLITSDYPCFRQGGFLTQFLYVVSLSPRKAMIYSTNPDVIAFDYLPVPLRAALINLYVLGNATRAFANSSEHGDFVRKHLGWARAHSAIEAKKAYVRKFIEEMYRHGGVVQG
ncbi:DUF4238 domain-containing protein [Uliginosibacterium sp. sgz301328]|uniref:DUF4238 domain-containing protein n=1 Tax=Uliginosibacterium sp. sgz301328 TaxID=3243764 RepID=UPI00359E924E